MRSPREASGGESQALRPGIPVPKALQPLLRFKGTKAKEITLKAMY
jgi:hypothetical protein